MRRRLNFITAGQTPRRGMLSETLSMLDGKYDICEYGALDGLSERQITELSPQSGEYSISTRMKNGSETIISETWLRYRIQEICNRLDRASTDVTVIGSTLSYGDIDVGHLVVHAEIALQNTLDTLSVAGQRIGEIVTLPAQQFYRRIVDNPAIQPAYAARQDDQAICAAANRLSDCDFIVLGSMGHSEKHRALVAKQTGKPVILMRRVIAGLISKSIADSRAQSGIDLEYGQTPYAERIKSLSGRERQVFELVIQGMASKSIARVLGISHRTVEVHRSRIMEKMGVANAMELISRLHNSGDQKAN